MVEVVAEGHSRATESLILGVSSVDVGSPLTPADIAETIRRLYRLGIFSNIRVDAEQVEGGFKVFIVVSELPKLVGIEFEGNKKIKEGDLREKIGLGVGGYISPFLVSESRNRITEEYASRGYFQAIVKPSLLYNADSTEATLSIEVIEKSKVKVEKVIITGNVRVRAGDLVGKMRNRKRGFLKSSDFAQDKFQEDLEKVIAEYHKRGFIDAHMVSDSMAIDSLRNRMTIYLELYEGPQYYFGGAEFAENNILDSSYLTRLMTYKSGDVFNEEKYEESLFELYFAYQDIGHLHVNILDERNTRADSIIDITYRINEGLPSKINLVKIVGNTKTKEKVIRRELSALPGQTYNRSRLIRSIRDVMALNYFENVIPTPVSLPNGDVDLEFEVKEKQTGQISAGAGYNSQDKVVGTLGMGIPNFRGNGQNLTFNIEFGRNRNSMMVSFTEPWMFGRPTLFGTDVYTTNRRWFTDYTEGRKGGSLKLGRRLRWPDNYFRIFASYRLERNRFHDFSDLFEASSRYKRIDVSTWQELDTNPESTTYLDTLNLISRDTTFYEPYPGSIVEYDERWRTSSRFAVTVTRDSRNLPEFATSGSLFTYTLENTGGLLGGFWEYQKHRISIAKFFPLFWNMALATKVEYGVVTSPAGDDHILVTDRFTPGGTTYQGVIRGYDDGVLTPDSVISLADTLRTLNWDGNPNDSNSQIISTTVDLNSRQTRVRGKYLLTSNIELQIPISERQIYALVFFDAGNSWLHRKKIKPFTGVYKAWGFGFRIVVPGIGTIGFDFAKPLDEFRGVIGGWKPHFQMGTTFR